MVYGVAADSSPELRRFRNELALPFTLLSDPDLRCGEALEVPISTATAYYSALALHPSIRHYRRKAYLQPALFVWKDTALGYEWRQTEKLRNLFGATGRPSGADVLQIVSSAVGDHTGGGESRR